MAFSQVPHTLLLVRPAQFGSNPETLSSNAFQQVRHGPAQLEALKEFEGVVKILEAHHIRMVVVDDTPEPVKPDAIFPNNWFSTHEDGRLILYPMMAGNRRLERRPEIIELLRSKYQLTTILDLSAHERDGHFLEGTGSLVFDHANRIVYACQSPRTDSTLVDELCRNMNYRKVFFHAIDEHGVPVYHTNVMMWVGKEVAAVCLDAVRNESEQEAILGGLMDHGHRVVAISFEQMRSFAGNMIEVESADHQPYLLMSSTAFKSLLPGQIVELEKHVTPLPVDVSSIETLSGGSIRCMVAGIHLPLRDGVTVG